MATLKTTAQWHSVATTFGNEADYPMSDAAPPY